MHLITHECGCPIWMKSYQQQDYYLVYFFDAREEGMGQKIHQCPNCAKALGEELEPTFVYPYEEMV
jgi:hypothetical protein